MLTAESRRRSFPMLDEMVYLNTAAEGMPPVEVGEALAIWTMVTSPTLNFWRM